jgi:hypothetical protein
MKAFTFRLEQALRWRETQLSLQKSRVAVAAARVAEIEAALNAWKADLAGAADSILQQPTGAALSSYAGFKQKSRALIRDCEAQDLLARRTLALEMNRMLDASQKLRLLENLRRAAQGRWNKEFDRELAAFADEAFLSRIQSGKQRTGA